MALTDEQQTVVDYIKNNEGLTQIEAVAGSGKTFLLTEICKAMSPKRALYLAYNKSIATEATHKFPKQVECVTTHALAYDAIFRILKYDLNLEDRITYRILPNTIPYEQRCEIIDAIEHFCLTEYIEFDKFAKECTNLPSAVIQLAEKALNMMVTGQIPCSHSFYLKLFHIALVHEDIEYEPFDILMLDEAGDINLVTLEIFKLLPSKRKIMVGDPHQNIYAFNKTVNCFKLMSNEAKVFPLSQSFRVSNKIANRVEQFCKTNLHEEMRFEGIEVEDTEIRSEAIIARTNATLIIEMLELNKKAIPYNLTRKPDDMFKILKMLCLLKPKSFVSVPGYTYLQKDVDKYATDEMLQRHYKSALSYIKEMHKEDVALTNTITLIFSYGIPTIMDCYNTAKKYQVSKKKHFLTLGTAHSTKGLEFDKVTLAPDMNKSVSDIVFAIKTKQITPEELTIDLRTELNLYYVACSRARKELHNALYL